MVEEPQYRKPWGRDRSSCTPPPGSCRRGDYRDASNGWRGGGREIPTMGRKEDQASEQEDHAGLSTAWRDTALMVLVVLFALSTGGNNFEEGAPKHKSPRSVRSRAGVQIAQV